MRSYYLLPIHLEPQKKKKKKIAINTKHKALDKGNYTVTNRGRDDDRHQVIDGETESQQKLNESIMKV
jgi:hypothetical protein